MRKVIALPLVLASFTSIAQGTQSGEIQPYPDYLAAYVKTLVNAGCEQALKGDSEDALIKQVTQGMKKVHRATMLFTILSLKAQVLALRSKRKGG